MRGTLSACRRELARFLEQKSVFMTLFVAALIYSWYYPQPYRAEALRDIPIAVVDLDQTVASRELTRRIDETSDVAVAVSLPDFLTAQREVFKRTISGVLVIPLHFERDLLHGRASPISLYSDDSYFLVNSRISSAVTSTARAFGTEVEIGRLVAQQIDLAVATAMTSPMPLTTIALFNPQGGYATYILPGAFTLILQQTLLIAVCLLATLTHEPGARDRIAPAIGATATVCGKLAAYLAIGTILVPFYFIVIPYLYGIPRLGSVPNILIAAAPFILSVAALGMVLGLLIRSPLIAQLSTAAVGMPLFFLSGFSWPQESLPPGLHALAQLIPGSMGITAMTRVVEMGATISDIREQFLGLWALTFGYALLAMLLEARVQSRLSPMAATTANGARTK